jgi:hypothetical protein
MEVSGQLHTRTALAPRKEPLVPTKQEDGWTPEMVWMLWRREEPSPVGNQTLAVQPLTYLFTELSPS